MENNQPSNNEDQQQNSRNNQESNDNLNTASGLRNELQQQQDDSGSGRSYDYGAEGSTEEDLNQDLGRNSNQQTVSNPVNTPGTGNDNMPGLGSSRAGSGSAQTTKQSTSGSDYDGQTRTS